MAVLDAFRRGRARRDREPPDAHGVPRVWNLDRLTRPLGWELEVVEPEPPTGSAFGPSIYGFRVWGEAFAAEP